MLKGDTGAERDASPVAQDALDVTSADVLRKLFAELRRRGLEIYLAEVHAPVLDFARRAGLMDLIAEDHMFRTLPAAVEAFEEASSASGGASS